jgi:uncharacterized membrane protein YiaA
MNVWILAHKSRHSRLRGNDGESAGVTASAVGMVGIVVNSSFSKLTRKPDMKQTATIQVQRPTGAFIAASWVALLVGAMAFLIGLWNAPKMQLNEQGYYFTILMYGLFAAVSLQKSVRDRLEGIRVTSMYYGLCWVSLAICLILLSTGLWNATLASSEKGFYAMSFLLSLFGAVAVQKNVRDVALLDTASAADEESLATN